MFVSMSCKPMLLNMGRFRRERGLAEFSSKSGGGGGGGGVQPLTWAIRIGNQLESGPPAPPPPPPPICPWMNIIVVLALYHAPVFFATKSGHVVYIVTLLSGLHWYPLLLYGIW